MTTPGKPAFGYTTLRLPALRSPNYVAGSTGWTVNQDGSAEFNNVTVRGTILAGHFIGTGEGEEIVVYSGTPAANNVITSIVSAAAVDSSGNSILAGTTVYGFSSPHYVACQVNPTASAAGLAIQWYAGTSMAAWTADATASIIGGFGTLNLSALKLQAVLGTLQISSSDAIEWLSAVAFNAGIAVTGGTTTDTLNVTTKTAQISDGTNTWSVDRSVTSAAAISKTNPTSGVDITATWTIAANDAQVGTVYRIEVPFNGVWEASGALNLEYDLNGTIANLVPLATGLATAGHNYGGVFRLYLQVLTTGASGTCRIWADGGATDTSVARGGSTSTDLFGVVSPNPAFNSTINNTLAVAAFFTTSNASQTIIGEGSTFTRLGA